MIFLLVPSLALSLFLSFPAQQMTAAAAAGVLGTWEGESICTVKNSPCHDEHVVYEIVADNVAATSLTMNAFKIDNGKRGYMGVLHCEYHPAEKKLSCTSHGVKLDDWQYKVSNGVMEGTLKINAGNTLYRKITLKKKPDV